MKWGARRTTPIDRSVDSCACTNVGGDGFDDLVLKFKKKDILTAIGPVIPGDVLTLSLSGELLDGTPFVGADCVVIRDDDDDDDGGPEDSSGISLGTNFPNPFNPSTKITFALSAPSHVTIDIFNVTGQRVATLADAEYSAGQHSVTWQSVSDNGTSVASGMYFYRMKAGEFVQTRKMVLLK